MCVCVQDTRSEDGGAQSGGWTLSSVKASPRLTVIPSSLHSHLPPHIISDIRWHQMTLMNDCLWLKVLPGIRPSALLSHHPLDPALTASDLWWPPVTSVHAETEPGARAGRPGWSAACMQVSLNIKMTITSQLSPRHFTLCNSTYPGMDGAGGSAKSSPPLAVCWLGGGGGSHRAWGWGPMLPRCRSHGLRGFSLRVSRWALVTKSLAHDASQSGSQSTSPGVFSSWPSSPSSSSWPARHVRGIAFNKRKQMKIKSYYSICCCCCCFKQKKVPHMALDIVNIPYHDR